MESPSPTFCSFEKLVDWIHAESPRSRCAYLGNVGSPCRTRMGRSMFNEARSIVKEHLNILTELSGELTGTRPRSQVFEELVTRLLCWRHKEHDSRAIAQWRHEFSTKRLSIIAKLEVYYNYGAEHSSAEGIEKGADESDRSVYYSCDGETESEEGQQKEEAKDAVEGFALEKQEISISSPPSTPARVRRRYYTIPKDEVSKHVTLLVEETVKGKSELKGWIYVIRLPDLPGTFKVGYTEWDPEVRFKEHGKCYPNLEVVHRKLIPHAYRVEQLMLREFANDHCELETGCRAPKCKGTCHRELLKVDEKTLLESLEKWITFVESYPYNKWSGKLKPNIENLPLPALRSYLGAKPSPLPISPRSPPENNGEYQDSQKTHQRALNLKPIVSGPKTPSVDEVELDSDDLSSRIRDLHVTQDTPSKPKRRVK